MQLSLVSSYKSGSSHPSTEDMEQDVVVKHLTSVPTILRIRSCPWDTVPEEATLPSQADYFKEQSVTSLGQGYKLYTELTKAYLSYTSVLITGFWPVWPVCDRYSRFFNIKAGCRFFVACRLFLWWKENKILYNWDRKIFRKVCLWSLPDSREPENQRSQITPTCQSVNGANICLLLPVSGLWDRIRFVTYNMRTRWVVEGLEPYEITYVRCATSPKYGPSCACHMLLYKKAFFI
jgi:hypothetical protein